MDQFTFTAEHDTTRHEVTVSLAGNPLFVYEYSAYAPPSDPVACAMSMVAGRLRDVLGFEN